MAVHGDDALDLGEPEPRAAAGSVVEDLEPGHLVLGTVEPDLGDMVGVQGDHHPLHARAEDGAPRQDRLGGADRRRPRWRCVPWGWTLASGSAGLGRDGMHSPEGPRSFGECGRTPRHTAGMAYDEELAHRIREVVEGEPGLGEKRMFGGLAFLVNGNMAVSASGQGGLLLRIDPGQADSLVDQEHVRRF